MEEKVFRFLDYSFNEQTFEAVFNYEGSDGIIFTERISFSKTDKPIDKELLNRALFLCFVLIGTSYYKAHPTKRVVLHECLDDFQAQFFSTVYQDGLSQYAFENQLERKHLAHFESTGQSNESEFTLPKDFSGILSLQSGGKDSLLTAALLSEQTKNPYSFWYLGSSTKHPKVLDELNEQLQIAIRKIDMENLSKTGGKNGHVPVTYIVQSLALVQAILNHQKAVFTSIGQEGNEAHTVIYSTGGVGNNTEAPEPDLPVNHQWSKTWPAEKMFAEYVKKYIAKDLEVGSPLRQYSELKIAELFVEKCWEKYSRKFSSCNVANYRQQNDNTELHWCGKCPKCANSYLLFSPFVEPNDLNSIFNNQNLFQEPSLNDDFKGLLGIENVMKPFECVGETTELRAAYAMRKDKSENSSLPFEVPENNPDYSYETAYPSQKSITSML